MNKNITAVLGVTVLAGLGITGSVIAKSKDPPLPTQISVKDQKRAKVLDSKLQQIKEEADEFDADLAEKYSLVDGCDTVDWVTRKINRKTPCTPKK